MYRKVQKIISITFANNIYFNWIGLWKSQTKIESSCKHWNNLCSAIMKVINTYLRCLLQLKYRGLYEQPIYFKRFIWKGNEEVFITKIEVLVSKNIYLWYFSGIKILYCLSLNKVSHCRLHHCCHQQHHHHFVAIFFPWQTVGTFSSLFTQTVQR